jgi:hypothetical protein
MTENEFLHDIANTLAVVHGNVRKMSRLLKTDSPDMDALNIALGKVSKAADETLVLMNQRKKSLEE